MKRKIVNMGTIGIVVIILLVGVLNYKQAAETKMKKIETEENSVRENKTNYTNEQDSSNICEMTEEEAAKAVFDYIYSDCDYDYDAKVISTMQQGEMVYLYQTKEKSDLQYEMLQSKDRTEDGQYYVFAHDTRYVTDALSQGFYDEYHTDYAVNRKTGEVLRESQWIETDAGYKLLYSEAYEKAVNQLYFNEDVSDGKMLEEQAARALFYYMYSDEGDYDSIVVRTYKQEQSVYVYQFPEDQEFPCVRNFSCRGMTEDQEYYIFADYTDYYTHGYEPVFTHYQYLTSYAVNRETGEVLRERESVSGCIMKSIKKQLNSGNYL